MDELEGTGGKSRFNKSFIFVSAFCLSVMCLGCVFLFKNKETKLEHHPYQYVSDRVDIFIDVNPETETTYKVFIKMSPAGKYEEKTEKKIHGQSVSRFSESLALSVNNKKFYYDESELSLAKFMILNLHGSLKKYPFDEQYARLFIEVSDENKDLINANYTITIENNSLVSKIMSNGNYNKKGFFVEIKTTRPLSTIALSMIFMICALTNSTLSAISCATLLKEKSRETRNFIFCIVSPIVTYILRNMQPGVPSRYETYIDKFLFVWALLLTTFVSIFSSALLVYTRKQRSMKEDEYMRESYNDDQSTEPVNIY